MTRLPWLAVLALVGGAACAPPPPEQQVIDDAAAALGGRDVIEGATSLTLEAEGVMGNLGQDMTPEATGQTFTVSDYTRQIDLTAGRARVEQTRTPNFMYFRGPDPMSQELTLSAAETLHHPLALLRAAMEPGATVANARTADGESQVDVTTSSGHELTLAIDEATKLPTRITSAASHPNLRDVQHHTTFGDYEAVGDLQLPTSLTFSIDDHTITDLDVTAQRVDDEVGELPAPAPPPAPPEPTVEVEELADGVWLLGGESHHSVLAEFEDHLLLFEAPSEARTLAVIETARELVPDKPLTHLVSSHHHFDHSGGVRAAVSEGLTVVTHVGNAAFYQNLAARPSTIEPDALARNPNELSLQTVDDMATHGDDTNTVELHHIAGNPHGDTLLMAYFPRQRILVEADAFSPGRDYQPYAANLLENIERLDLRVERIAPVHGTVVPFEALEEAVRGGT